MQLIDYLAKQLRDSATYNSSVQVGPAAILWTDIECQWQSAMPYIKQHLPELLELGDYQPELGIGPAIWIKCVIAGVLDECKLPQDRIPIIYLPGIGRKDLRAIEQCADELRPLAELQYRGCWWAYNSAGRDWSVASFLTNPRVGLELDVAKDKKTQAAILQILPELLETPAESLIGKKLEAQDFISIVMNDPAKDVLAWLNNPKEKHVLWQDSKWPLFKLTCVDNLQCNPDTDDINSILLSLCEAEGAWQPIWQRFEDTAHNLPLLIEKLRDVTPRGLAFNASHYLSENLKDEQELVKHLTGLAGQDVAKVRETLINLDEKHQDRKTWLWTQLGYSSNLAILTQLLAVAEHTKIPFSGPSIAVMAEHYQHTFWQADAAALNAMALAKGINQQQMVADILALIYTPWLEQVALNFQNLVRSQGYPGSGEVQASTAQYQVGSQVVFFVDGLRFDTAKMLQQKLQKLAIKINLTTSWCALPSLTATAKAAVTPVAELLSGLQDNDNFKPVLTGSESEFSAYHLKKTLTNKSWQYLDGLETGEAAGLAWVQTGDLDNMGHEQQLKMPLSIDAILEDIVARVKGLLDSGWQHIRIVTDHGWLWVPNQFAEASISKNVVKKRLARCAILKDNVETAELKVGWYWNPNVSVAMAPGIAGYVAGDFYNHGGLSLQECLTPVLNIHAQG